MKRFFLTITFIECMASIYFGIIGDVVWASATTIFAVIGMYVAMSVEQ